MNYKILSKYKYEYYFIKLIVFTQITVKFNNISLKYLLNICMLFFCLQPLTVVSKIAPKPSKPAVVTTNKNISTAQMVMIPTLSTSLAPANKVPLAPANKVAIPPTQPNPTKLAASLKAALANSESPPAATPKEEPDSNGK